MSFKSTAIIASTLFLSTGVNAATVQVQFTGSIDHVSTELLGGPVNVNDSFIWTFDVDTAPINSGSDTSNYWISNLVLNIGNNYNVSGGSNIGDVLIANNWPSSAFDMFQVGNYQVLGMTGPTVNNVWNPDSLAGRIRFDGDYFSSTSLPNTLDMTQAIPALTSMKLRFNVDDSVYYGLDITSASISTVPVPATVWLFGSGLIGLIGIARRKK